MSNEILDNILDDEIESSTPTDQFNLFDNLLEDKKPSVTLKISKTAGKVFDDVIKMAHDITEKERIEEPDDHNLMPYGQSLDPEEETLTFNAPYDPHAPKSKPEPSMSKEEEFVKFVEEEYDGYKPYYTPILNQQVQYLKDQKVYSHHSPASNTGDLTLLAIPRMLDNLVITDLIGIQPMTGPVGQIFHLDVNNHVDDANNHKLSMEITSSVVEAGSRKLATRITPELVQDLNTFYNMDGKHEVAAAISQEVSGEINDEWLHDIRNAAHEVTGSITNDKHILLRINTASTMIAQRSRRGFGNWIVVNPTMLARIVMAADSLDSELRERDEKYKEVTYQALKHDTTELRSLAHVGVYRDVINVYCDILGTDDNEILVGYKGNNETDNGMIYSPYIMMMSSGVAVNPTTFEPVINFMTRYGKWVSENASNYYTKLTIE